MGRQGKRLSGLGAKKQHADTCPQVHASSCECGVVFYLSLSVT